MAEAPEKPPKREVIKELGERAEEVLKKVGGALEATAERIEKHDIPKLVRNAMVAVTGAMTVYVMGTAVATMLPAAVPVFQQLGITIGYIIPIMLNLTMVATMLGLVRMLIR